MGNLLTIWHIGGRGNPGPIGKLFKYADVVLVEAYLGDGNVARGYTKIDDTTILVSECIYKTTTQKDFFVMNDARASSLYELSPKAIDYETTSKSKGKHRSIWRDVCRTESTIQLDTITLEEMRVKYDLSLPDVLSLDIQGGEYDALLGAGGHIMDSVLAVVTEVEFNEIYKDQPLFSDQQDFLSRRGFLLFDLFSAQSWHHGLPFGKGMLTVAEAFYMKDYRTIKDTDTLLKLALIAYVFERYSYAYYILDNMKTDNIHIKELLDFYKKTKEERDE